MNKTVFRVLAIFLLVVWFVSVFIFALGKLLHLLLILAVVSFVLSRRRKRRQKRLTEEEERRRLTKDQGSAAP